MDLRPRALGSHVLEDLERRMVFVAGPRQVGKTTLAKSVPGALPGYLNWDVRSDRDRILREELPASDVWVFDEIHKYRRWRNYLKGVYDSRPAGQRILVTGSGRLDLYRFGGDSLQGRYSMMRLHPFSVAELGLRSRDEVLDLIRLGGFPEPWLSGSERQARRWSRNHRSRLIEEEVATLEGVRDLGQLELMMLSLPERVASPLSINALSEDLRISHKTASGWLDAAERLYAIFRLAPFGSPVIRAVRKQQKHYHLDWTLPPGDGPRFENFVACHLLKWVHWRQDIEGEDLELRYLRDRDGHEVDFVVTDRGEPRLLVECKWSDARVERGLRYFSRRFPQAAAWQISATGHKDYQTAEGIRVAPAVALLSNWV